jgi:hypothetical protein
MKRIKLLLLIFVLPLLAFTTAHKYYISVTQIEYIKDKQSVQIISRIFIDDFESLLQKRYDEKIILNEENELIEVNSYIEMYLTQKIKVKINEKDAQVVFLGKEYEDDIVRCFLEIDDIESINSFEISNKVLFDLKEEQQNIVKLNINFKKKSFLLTAQKQKALLKFN